MRKTFMSFCLIFTLLCTLLTVTPTSYAAENPLAPYLAILEEMNKELGTDYTFPTAEQMETNGESYNELIAFYCDMNTDEFRDYVLAAYKNEVKSIDVSDSISVSAIDNALEPLASSKTQKYYYNASNNNYLSITSTVYNADGAIRYSSIDSFGYGYSSYPYYKPSTMSKSFSSGNTKVTCTFTCTKYVAQNLISTTSHTIKVTFESAGGNIYTTI